MMKMLQTLAWDDTCGTKLNEREVRPQQGAQSDKINSDYVGQHFIMRPPMTELLKYSQVPQEVSLMSQASRCRLE